MAATFLIGSLLDLPIALATLPGWPPLSEVSGTAWWGLAHLTLIVTLFGLAFQNKALQRLDASRSPLRQHRALLTVVWAPVLHEPMTPGSLWGGSCALRGPLDVPSRSRPR